MGLLKITTGVALVVVGLGCGRALAQHKHGQDDQHAKPEEHSKAEQKESKLPLCPVMGDSVDFNVKTMTDAGPVYFCCEGCVKKYESNPEKYAKKTAAQRAALAKLKRVQVNCPISGSPLDGKTFAVIEGKGVSFCCKGCVAKYEKEPAKYAAKLEAGYTYQTRCPVMGGKIDPAVYTDLPTGERIYLCCPSCEARLLKNPGKYAPKLAVQGINIDVAKMSGKSAGPKPAEGQHDHKGHDHP